MKTESRNPILDAIDAEEAYFTQECLRDLQNLRDWIAREGFTTTDVRLRISEDGDAYSIFFGDASCDDDHRGYWGASSLSFDDDEVTLISTARDLVDQAIDDAYQTLS